MKCPNGLNKTKLVSFPRCGHHLMVRGLQWSLQGKLIYSNKYNSVHNFDNCDYVNLQKSHDFDLRDGFDEDYHYIVLIRGFELAIESWYLAAKDTFKIDTSLEMFRKQQLKYYDDFTAKWVATKKPNTIVISYSDFVSNKVDVMVKVTKFISDTDITPERMEWIKKWELAEKNKRLIKTKTI